MTHRENTRRACALTLAPTLVFGFLLSACDEDTSQILVDGPGGQVDARGEATGPGKDGPARDGDVPGPDLPRTEAAVHDGATDRGPVVPDRAPDQPKALDDASLDGPDGPDGPADQSIYPPVDASPDTPVADWHVFPGDWRPEQRPHDWSYEPRPLDLWPDLEACGGEASRSCYTGPLGTQNVGPCHGGGQLCIGGHWLPCTGEITPQPETCDGVDNDCDGQIDDGVVQACYSGPSHTLGVGLCHAGTKTCSKGQWGSCAGEVIPVAETCDNKDNNCNRLIDDAVFRSCYTGPAGTEGKGLCHAGQQTCTAGQWGSCSGQVTPTNESCDGKDNNCNNAIDDGITPQACYTGPSGTEGKGICHGGTRTCLGGAWGSCIGEVKPNPSGEVCGDGLDNDCNGLVDARACYTGPTGTKGVGVCKGGTEYCSGSSWSGVCSGQVTPASSESCDNLDNDCDGQKDEGLTKSCYTGPAGTQGVGICKAGTSTCSSGVWGSCSGQVLPASSESCDNKDNNCNGSIDEGLVDQSCYEGPSGTLGVGVCKAGKRTCSGGAWGTCTGQVTPAMESCDGKDNNCNNAVDDGGLPVWCYTGPAGTEGVGICHSGLKYCSSGSYGTCQNQQVPLASELCNGFDDDCDGTVDNDCHR